jgi:hypothetical protein
MYTDVRKTLIQWTGKELMNEVQEVFVCITVGDDRICVSLK